MPYGCAGQDKASQSAGPKGLRIGDRVGRRVILDFSRAEPRVLQEFQKLCRVTEAIDIVTLRHLRRHRYANLGNGVAKDALDSLAGRNVPPGKRDASARF